MAGACAWPPGGWAGGLGVRTKASRWPCTPKWLQRSAKRTCMYRLRVEWHQGGSLSTVTNRRYLLTPVALHAVDELDLCNTA